VKGKWLVDLGRGEVIFKAGTAATNLATQSPRLPLRQKAVASGDVRKPCILVGIDFTALSKKV
jgi:hypothetical protein